MRIELNGTPIETDAPTLAMFIIEQGVDGTAIATALDGVFVPRDARDGARLSAGAKVEILSPMQGG